MFQFLSKNKKPVFDPSLGDHLGSTILREARLGKLTTLLSKVDLLRGGEWDRRAFYIDLVGRYFVNPQNIALLPDTPLGNLIRGNVEIHTAWKARGNGTADTVSDAGWNAFFQHLDVAGRSLVRAAEQDVEDPTPLGLLQTVAQGLQLDRHIADTWFNEAVRRDPLHQQAHYRRLFLLCKKWGGSHEEMYAFARATMERTPTSSTLYCIIYLAHQEHLLYLRAFDNNREGAQAFLHDEQIREESIKVYQMSLQKRKSIERVSDYWPHNIAAWWFHVLNVPNLVRQETRKIGPHFTEFPWSFYEDPAAIYQKALNR